LVVSGQIGLEHGTLVTGGVQAELRQALANLAGLLAGEGASLTDVVKTTVFLRHIDDYAPMNQAYSEVSRAYPWARWSRWKPGRG
jgi:2-iminobutanoate/2-iminopropanoate deaminase